MYFDICIFVPQFTGTWNVKQKPRIELDSKGGKTKQMRGIAGRIEFKSVEFAYPARPDARTLNSLSIRMDAGKTVALVGSSGSGKSTCIQLLQRFYDVDRGAILIDDVDIRDYNVKWLRRQLGVVNQEPILFGVSILTNIQYGRENLTMDEIVRAAKDANAHNFIMTLPQVNISLTRSLTHYHEHFVHVANN